MKNTITITLEEFNEAVQQTTEYLNSAARKKNTSPMAIAASGMLYAAFSTALMMKLFEDDEKIEIEKNK